MRSSSFATSMRAATPEPNSGGLAQRHHDQADFAGDCGDQQAQRDVDPHGVSRAAVIADVSQKADLLAALAAKQGFADAATDRGPGVLEPMANRRR